MKIDPKILETLGKFGKVTHAVRHIQSDSAVAVFLTVESANDDCSARNHRAEQSQIVGRYEVVALTVPNVPHDAV